MLYVIGLVESGVKMLGFGLSGLGFRQNVPTGVVSNEAVQHLYGTKQAQQLLKIVTLAGGNAAEGSGEGGHIITLSPSSLCLWSTILFDGVPSDLGNQSQWGECLAEYDLGRILSQDIITQMREKVTSQRDDDLTNRHFVIVDAMLYQYTNAAFPTVVSMAILSLAPSPVVDTYELWMHLIEFSLCSISDGGRVHVRLRRRVAFLHQPISKQYYPELLRRERHNDTDSLFITWFDITKPNESEEAQVNASYHALEVVDVEQYCTDISTGCCSDIDDSSAYLEYLHLHDSRKREDIHSSCLAEGVVTGMPVASYSSGRRPFLTANVVASLNSTAYNSSRNRATQAVPPNALPVYELMIIWQDGSIFSCLPPKASCSELYTTCKAVTNQGKNLSSYEIITNYIESDGRISENQCFTSLVTGTAGVSNANASGKLLSSASAALILEGALDVSKAVLNQRDLTSSASSGLSSDLLSHRLLMDKKQHIDKLFPLMQTVLENSNSVNLNLHDLSWHRALLQGSLVLSNQLREIRMNGESTLLTSNRSGQTKTLGKKRDLNSQGESNQDEFLNAVQRGMERVLPPMGKAEMPGYSAEDIFFAHPFLLPLGLYHIAKEIEQRHELSKGKSNHSLLATTCGFLSLLLGVIQSPIITDFSAPTPGIDTGGRKRAGTVRQKKQGSEEAKMSHIEEDDCCLALASNGNVIY